jgi:hypothetical protein
MEGSLVAYKVFTNGSVLQASEINDNLMRQSVMVFSNAAARTAAISSPVEGMLTWLEDVNRYESYNGSTWGSPFGVTLLVNQTFTAQTSVAVDNVFTSAYDDYRVVYEFQNSASSGYTINLRAAGSTVLGSDYKWQTVRTTGTGVTGDGATAASAWSSVNSNGVNRRQHYAMNIYNPARTMQTTMDAQVWQWDGSQSGVTQWGFEGNSLARDGIIITQNSGNITGSVKIYGMRK